ncbi:unnamed protein product [Sympodiomycopsis kandeliae]
MNQKASTSQAMHSNTHSFAMEGPASPASPAVPAHVSLRDHILAMRRAKQQQQQQQQQHGSSTPTTSTASTTATATTATSADHLRPADSIGRATLGLPRSPSQRLSQTDPSLLTWCVATEDEQELDTPQGEEHLTLNIATMGEHSSGSEGHSGGQDSASAEESTILGHQTMASLLNNNNNNNSLRKSIDTNTLRRSIDSTLSVVTSNTGTGGSGSGTDTISGPATTPGLGTGSSSSSSATRVSMSSTRSSSSSAQSRSSPRPASRSSNSSSRRHHHHHPRVTSPSPHGPPPSAPLPDLPSTNRSRRKSSSSSSGSGYYYNNNKYGPPNEKLPELPNAHTHNALSGNKSSAAGQFRKSVASSSTSSSSSPPLLNRTPPNHNQYPATFSSIPTSPSSPRAATSTSTNAWTADLSGREDNNTDTDDNNDHRYTSNTDTETETDEPRNTTSTKKNKKQSKVSPSASALQGILDEAERRRKSLMHKSIGGLISALDSEVEEHRRQSQDDQQSQEGEDTHAPQPSSASVSPSLEHNRRTSTNTAFFAMYDRDGNTTGADTDTDADADARPQQQQQGTPGAALPPMISIDAADSDETISADDDSGSDEIETAATPRKKTRAGRKPTGGQLSRLHSSASSGAGGFDAQRAAPSRQVSFNNGPNSNSKSTPAAPSSNEKESENPFAYYAFSPDLPPFVPQGLKPIDLTGRGTWMSIAARAGGFGIGPSPSSSTLASRDSRTGSISSSISLSPGQLAHSADDALSPQQGERKGPVSMRQLAAQTRAKQKQAEEFRKQQASILSAKKWSPFEIHAHAEDYAASQGDRDGHHHRDRSTLSSIYGSPESDYRSPRSRQSSQTFSVMSSHLSLASLAQSDIDGKAFNFDAHAAAWQDHDVRNLARRSEASIGVGMQRSDSVGSSNSGVYASNGPVKQYREFTQQTTPPASPIRELANLALRSEAGVGFDGDNNKLSSGVGTDSRQTNTKTSLRREYSVQSGTIIETSDNEGEETRPSTPIARTQVGPRRSFMHTKSTPSKEEEEEDIDQSSLRAPRLTSRRSNIGTSPLRKSHRNGNGGETTDAGQADESSFSSSASESDGDDSDESDLDLATPLETLALKMGAFDAVVQARGSKGKANQKLRKGGNKGEDQGEKVVRAIAGSARVVKQSPKKAGDKAGGSQVQPPLKSAAAVNSQSSSALRSPPSISEKPSSTPRSNLSTPLRSSQTLRRVASSSQPLNTASRSPARTPLRARKSLATLQPPRADSPDLEESFASEANNDDDDEDDDEDGDLLLSEMEFPQPVTGLGVNIRMNSSNPSTSSPPLHIPSTSTSSPSNGLSSLTQVETLSTPNAQEEEEGLNDTPMTNSSSGMWSKIGGSSITGSGDRDSTATTISVWSQRSSSSGHDSGSQLDKNGKMDSHPEAETSAETNEVATVSEEAPAPSKGLDSITAANGDNAAPTPTPAAAAAASATPLKSRLPAITPIRKGIAGRSSLPTPSKIPTGTTRGGGIPAPSSVQRRPSDLVQGVKSATPPPSSSVGLKPALKTPERTLHRGPPPSSFSAPPPLRKAASVAHMRPSGPGPMQSGKQDLPRRSISPGGIRYSTASPSMAVPDYQRASPRPSATAKIAQRVASPRTATPTWTIPSSSTASVIRKPSERRTAPPPASNSSSGLPLPKRRPSVHFAPT